METANLETLMVYANAFADHFLTDAFSAGHLRVPRMQLDAYADNPKEYLNSTGTTQPVKEDNVRSQKSGLYTLYLHNLEGGTGTAKGIPVVNAKGDRFTIKGDKRLFMDDDGVLKLNKKSAQFTMAVLAVQKSVEELYQVCDTGSEITGEYEATMYVPWPSLEADSLIKVVAEDGSPSDRRAKVNGLMNSLYDGFSALQGVSDSISSFKDAMNTAVAEAINNKEVAPIWRLYLDKKISFKESANRVNAAVLKEINNTDATYTAVVEATKNTIEAMKNMELAPIWNLYLDKKITLDECAKRAYAAVVKEINNKECKIIYDHFQDSKKSWDEFIKQTYGDPFNTFLTDFPDIMKKFPHDIAHDIDNAKDANEPNLTASELRHIAGEYLKAMRKIE